MLFCRNGIQVFAVPIPLGLLILTITLVARCYRKRRVLRGNRSCVLWLSLGLVCAATAVTIFALIETTRFKAVSFFQKTFFLTDDPKILCKVKL